MEGLSKPPNSTQSTPINSTHTNHQARGKHSYINPYPMLYAGLWVYPWGILRGFKPYEFYGISWAFRGRFTIENVRPVARFRSSVGKIWAIQVKIWAFVQSAGLSVYGASRCSVCADIG